MLDEYTRANLNLWNEWADVHERSGFYDVDGFKAGASTLLPIELDELGPQVAGKELLHLQCHLGLDTLSWARLGASVTGADFSPRAVAVARSLAAETGLPATFVESTVEDLPSVLDRRFDIVFTSWGAIMWLRDLGRWAEVVAHFLRPGGVFYMAEFHPVALTLDDEHHEPRFSALSYFHTDEPERFDSPGTYAEPEAATEATVSYEWQHTIGDVVSALADAGLVVRFVHEFPYTRGLRMKCLVAGADGLLRVRGHEETFPLSFSIMATL